MGRKRRRQDVGADRQARRNLQVAFDPALCRRHGATCLSVLTQQRLRSRQERRSCSSEANPSRRPLEEPRAELALEGGHLLTDSGLGEVERAGGFREAEPAGHRREDLDASFVH